MTDIRKNIGAEQGEWVPVDKDHSPPSSSGEYKVKVVTNDIPYTEAIDTDYFDGNDWDVHGYRQFLVAWWKNHF